MKPDRAKQKMRADIKKKAIKSNDTISFNSDDNRGNDENPLHSKPANQA